MRPRHGFQVAISDLASAAALVLLYVGLEWLSFLHEQNGLPVTPWNPGLGVLFAVVLLRGAAFGLVFFAGVLAAEMLVLRTELGWAVVIAIAVIVSLVYTTIAVAVRRQLSVDSDVFRTRDLLVLVVGGTVGAILVTNLLVLVLLTTRHFDISAATRTTAPLIVGDLIGITVMTPLLLRARFHRARLHKLSASVLIEAAGLVAAIALALWFAMPAAGMSGQNRFYVLFLPVVIAAVRHGIDGACAALAVTQLGVVSFLHWQGFELSRFTEYQMLMLALTLTGLLVGALVGERMAAEEDARISVARLQSLQAEAARASRFNLVSGMAAALAHEINQPMTAARALARSVQHLIRAPERDDERTATNVATMIDQIDHAAAVVRRMREFLRRGVPHMSTLDASHVVSEALALAQPLASTHQITLAQTTDGALPPIHGDRIYLQQVIINLVSNSIDAIKQASGPSGKVDVWVRASSAGNEVEIGVIDNGVGVSGEEAKTLFEPLSTSKIGGLGLGLPICETIVKAHGDRIWLSGSVPGRTEFRVALPASQTPSNEGSNAS